jgi:serine/threonine protein kinase
MYKALLDTASGLDYLHSIGVVHGDLKTANVLLKGGKEQRGVSCKITDFGLSRVLDMNASHISTGTHGEICQRSLSSLCIHSACMHRASANTDWQMVLWQGFVHWGRPWCLCMSSKPLARACCCRPRPAGTIVYMPKELLLSGRMTPATDIYSFGLMSEWHAVACGHKQSLPPNHQLPMAVPVSYKVTCFLARLCPRHVTEQVTPRRWTRVPPMHR